MATSSRTRLDLINQSLEMLGEEPMTLAQLNSSSYRRGVLAQRYYETVRDATLMAHPWNFAMVRTTSQSFTEPGASLTPDATSGTCVTFTVSVCGVFGVDSVGMLLGGGSGIPGLAEIIATVTRSPAAALYPGGTCGTNITFTTGDDAVLASTDENSVIELTQADGEATITNFVNTCSVITTVTEDLESTDAVACGSWRLVSTHQVVAEITQNFAGTEIACGSWRLYNRPPPFDYTHTHLYPSCALRVWRTHDDERYAVENLNDQADTQVLVADTDTLNYRYIKQVTDERAFTPTFVRAFTSHLAAVLAEPVTGQGTKYDRFWNQYQAILKDARNKDGMEGTPEQLRNRELIDVRNSGGLSTWRRWWA